MKSRLSCGCDLILLVYPETETKAVLADRIRQLETLFNKAGLLSVSK
jgi:hypothetical protein